MPHAELINGLVKTGKDRLRVIIVGGSIAGLTLAHCLHHSDIDFVVLEARQEIAPQVGASIVVLPNGARILDQLGIFDDIVASVEPLERAFIWTGDGKLVVEGDAPLLAGTRMGYPLAFLTRADLLKVLYDHVKDKSKVLTSKWVTAIDQDKSGATVHCKDGSSYTGDIVVGADGIHSAVKTLMQDHIEKSSPGSTEKDRNGVSAEYNCIFGLGNPVKGEVQVGHSHRSYARDQSTLSFVGTGGILYWFLFSKLDKRYYGKDMPRYTKEDAVEAAKAFYDIHMTDQIKFDEVFEQRTFVNMSCVEESQNEHWTSDRIVCIGDSVHKMTPNLGAGGNAAIESAAALTNSLLCLGPKPSLEAVRKCLSQFQEKRSLRANITCDSANQLTRLEALRSLPEKVVALYVMPILSDFLVDVTCDAMTGAELLQSLPAPQRSLGGTMPWDPESGVGKKEKKWVRALYALPILAAVYGAQKTMGVTVEQLIPIIKTSIAAGQIDLGAGLVVPLFKQYFGIKGLDQFVAIFVAFFTPIIGNFDIASRTHAIAFLGDIVSLQTIWLVEGIRRGNFTTVAHVLPTVLGLLFQIKGLGYIAPIWFFLHYVQSPLENYQAADNRMTQIGAVKTIIPTVVLSFILPSIAMCVVPGIENRQWINGLLWQAFPLYASLYQRGLGYLVKDTTEVDRVSNPEADMPYLRRAYGFAAVIAATANLYVRVASPVPLKDLFFKGISSPSTVPNLLEGAAKFLRYDQIATFGAGAIWTMLSFRDLKKAGKLQTGWPTILGIFGATTLVAGPGAAVVTMWAWREEVLAARKKVVAKKN